MLRSRRIIAVLLLGALALAGCSQSYLRQGEKSLAAKNYQQAIDYLESALKEKPTDARVMRALGQAYYHKGDNAQAEKYLVEAQKGLPNDGSTLLYLGLVAEAKGDFAGAEGHYRGYLAKNGKSKAAEAVRGRLLYVQNENVRQRVAAAVKQESALGKEQPTPNTVGVLPFVVGDKADETTRSLATGLQTVTWYDLASLPEIKVVERLEVNYLIDELELAEKGFSEEKSAPRVGKLVRADKLLNANVNKPSDNALSLSSALVQTGNAAYTPTFDRESKLKEALKMQKDMVLAVVDSLGIEVKGSRRNALKKLPTESYEAFLAFSQGMELYDKGDYQKAKTMFDRAISLDPHFELAERMSEDAFLISGNSGSLDHFDDIVLASIGTQIETPYDPLVQVTTITNPTTQDPRTQEPPQTGTVGTAVVGGSIR